MTKRLQKLYKVYCFCLVVEILVVIICVVSLLFGAASFLEWLFLLVTSVVEIPSSIRTLHKIKNGEQVEKKIEDGSVVPSVEEPQA